MTSNAHKRRALAYAALLAAAMFATPGATQMYPGAGVSTNPAATGGARVLRYPGGQYMRVLPPLLEPGEPYPGNSAAPIHLRMPARAAHKAPPVAENEPAPEQNVSETSAPPLPPQAAPAKREAAVELAPEKSGAAPIPFSFGGESPEVSYPPPKISVAKPRETAKPEKTASAAPAGVSTSVSGLAKQAAILFDRNSSELSGDSSARLKDLSSGLNAALLGGADRVELIGYGGAPGDKSSDARRMSLKRALTIREALIVDGLPADRIDVRALGGVDDDGPANRVDIFVKG